MPEPFYHGSAIPESLADHIHDLAQAFTNAGNVLSDQYTSLNNATNGLLDGTFPWQGNAATTFSDTWQTFGKYMKSLQTACEDTSNALTRFANKLSDVEADQAWNFLLMIVGGIATIISVAATISDFGLTAGAIPLLGGWTSAEAQEVVGVSEEITQADTEAATDLQAVEDELTTVPALSGPNPNSTGDIPAAISPANLDEMTNLSDLTEDDSTLLAKGNSGSFKNPINMSMESTEANMPPGVNNPTGKYWIQQIKNLGVRVEWNRSVQVELDGQALGFTANQNFDPENGTPAFVVVGLSPDATNATVYEEFLHVQEAQARGWMRPLDPPVGGWTEEIKVEYQVLQRAKDLDMPSSEFDELSLIRQDYIKKLEKIYAQRGLAWPPSDLIPYLQDPPKLGN